MISGYCLREGKKNIKEKKISISCLDINKELLSFSSVYHITVGLKIIYKNLCVFTKKKKVNYNNSRFQEFFLLANCGAEYTEKCTTEKRLQPFFSLQLHRKQVVLF